MKVSELLECGLKTISDKSRWCQQPEAELENGDSCCATDPNAVRWCTIGAALRCGTIEGKQSPTYYEATSLLDEMCLELDDEDIQDVVTLNDEEGYEAVIDCYQRAIAEAKLLGQ